jgi:hypothetical protein
LRVHFLVAAMLLVLAAWPRDVLPQSVVHDDFPGSTFSPANWYPCYRPENVLSLRNRPGGGREASLLARPLGSGPAGSPRKPLPTRQRHPGCTHHDGTYTPDGDQRAELWEAVDLWQAAGTDTWIRFDFKVDRLPAGAAVPHLVVGQLKLEGGSSPVLAQRFARRHFTVTIEQDDRSPGAKAGDSCRILVAHDASLRKPLAGSVRHDARGVVRALKGVHGAAGCKQDVTVDAREFLPSAFDKWVRMTYRIKPGLTDGQLEVWADGRLVSTAAGRIGYGASFESPGRFQYFKFGPYAAQQVKGKPPLAVDVKASFARYRRAPSCGQLGEPSAPECLSK